MRITITVDGLTRDYEADIDTLNNNDWNEIVLDLMDSATPDEVPGFEGTRDALNKLKIK